ncbi:MAG: N-acetyl-gamma-glutamyl-phosphate reductase [Planctomycetes bacterium]|nr:N-acetyl-gamma-glutamyl-phosphate reductase [Planctomycetota bacterium]
MIRAAILGASGYAGNELIRLGLRHGGIEFVALNSENHAGEPVSNVVPEAPRELRFTNRPVGELNADRCDVVFCAMPAGFALETAPRLTSRVIDLSADFRADENVPYGLPELFRAALPRARIVANPGCYATAAILSAWPLVRHELAGSLIFDGKSGYSGAGRAPAYVNDPVHFTDNTIAYKLTQHRHRAEIGRVLRHAVGFTPHVIPTFRGILMTTHCLLRTVHLHDRPDTSPEKCGQQIRSLFHEVYDREPFLRFVEDRPPELHDVQGTNLCALGGFEVDETGRAVVIATLDNLVKGAAGQAIQNMNVMFGEAEGRGLTDLTPFPAGRRGP